MSDQMYNPADSARKPQKRTTILKPRPETLVYYCGVFSATFTEHGFDTKQALTSLGWSGDAIKVTSTAMTQLQSLQEYLDRPNTTLEATEMEDLWHTNNQWVRDQRVIARWSRYFGRTQAAPPVRSPLILARHLSDLARYTELYKAEFKGLSNWLEDVDSDSKYPCGSLEFLKGHQVHCVTPHRSKWGSLQKQNADGKWEVALVCIDGARFNISIEDYY